MPKVKISLDSADMLDFLATLLDVETHEEAVEFSLKFTREMARRVKVGEAICMFSSEGIVRERISGKLTWPQYEPDDYGKKYMNWAMKGIDR